MAPEQSRGDYDYEPMATGNACTHFGTPGSKDPSSSTSGCEPVDLLRPPRQCRFGSFGIDLGDV